MNLNNNTHRINSSIVKTINSKAMSMGILLIATLVVSNTNGTAFAQDGNDNIMGCANTVKVTVSHLPKQTTDAPTEVTLSNIGPSDDRGYGNIAIPGIGSGHVMVNFHIDSIKAYRSEVSNIPAQIGESNSEDITEGDVCGQSIHPLHLYGF